MMAKGGQRGLVWFVLMSPFFFAWAYVRPEAPTIVQLFVIGLAAVLLAIAAFWVAGRLLDVLGRDKRI